MTNKLPQGWVECELEDFVSIMDSYRKPINSDEREQRLINAVKTYPYYGATGQVGYIDDYIFEGEAILLGEDGAPFLDPYKNKAYIVSGQYWVNNHAHILQGCGGIDNKFVCHLLNSIQYHQYVSGTTRLKLNQATLKKIQCKLPPLNEQKRIVEKIEEEFGKIDEGVEKLKLAREQIKQYRQSVLKSAFDGKLYKTTEWEEKTLEEITSILGDGLHGTPKYSDDGDYYFINGNNLNDGVIQIKDDTKKVDEEEYQKYKKDLNENTVFVSINGTLGNTAFYNNEKIILGKSACYFNLLPIANKEFIRFLLKTNNFINYANTNATGSTIKNVSLKTMRAFKINLPTLDEQKQIVKEIEKRFEVADEVERVITENLEKAEQLKQSILKKAFEGRLVPQDPTDEPASVLLEKIKAERGKN